MHYRYEEARPDVMLESGTRRIAYLPVGPLEFHGPHLPLGTDPLIAEGIVAKAVAVTGGVSLPTLYMGSGALPLPYTVAHAPEVLGAVVDSTLGQLADHGFEVVVVVSGHGALDHLHTLREACDALSAKGGATGVMAMWNELTVGVDGDIHDHGARVETSYLLSLRPELVDLGALEADPDATHLGVYGPNPRYTADAGWGDVLVGAAVSRLVERVEAAVATGSTDNWGDFRRLVERLQAGPLSLVDDSLAPIEGGLEFRVAHPGEQSKYLTTFEVVIDGVGVPASATSLRNESVGEVAAPRSASDLGPTSGTYLRRGQELRVEVKGVAPDGPVVEVEVRAMLAGVLVTGARGSLSLPPMS